MKASIATLALAIVLSMALGAPAQVTANVGPSTAPVGCPITISLSNDTNTPVGTGVCPFVVRDSTGMIVYSPICILILQILMPGQIFETTWNQIDNASAQVPPGNYTVDVIVPSAGIQPFSITIGGTSAAMVYVGAPRIGTNRNIRLCAPTDPGQMYVVACSTAINPGIPSCGGVIPLNPDPLFFFSLMPNNGIFLNFQGNLDGMGVSSSPSVAIPNDPLLIGVNFVFDFIVADPQAICPILRIGDPLFVTVQ